LVKNSYMEIAALVNADYIVTGRIFEDEGEKIINLKLTRCSDGKIYGKCFFMEMKAKKDFLEKIAIQAAAFVNQSLKNKHKHAKSRLKYVSLLFFNYY
jgi:hypothetical protein